jgi:hypothetical protein
MSNDLAKQLRADAEAYRQSLASPDTDDMFSLAYQWQDKKHRHVYDLCRKLETAADRIEKLEAALQAVIRYAGNAGDDYLADQARKALEGKE